LQVPYRLPPAGEDAGRRGRHDSLRAAAIILGQIAHTLVIQKVFVD
jgi:hypothetical protein